MGLRQLALCAVVFICAACAVKDGAAPVDATGAADTKAVSQAVAPSNAPSPHGSDVIPPLLGALPATFKGDLPCADCTAIQYQLDLFADHTYDLSMIHRGKPSGSTNQTGRWESAGANNITLLGGRAKVQFAILNANSLRLLNQNGSPIESALNYTLTRDTQTTSAELINTAWRLTRLHDQPAQRFDSQREPQIVLSVDNRVTGSDGCNRITGSYRRSNSDISLSQLASTQMACMFGMAQAGRFTAALGNVARYRITGRHLELLDASGTLLLRFEAVFVR
jgi:heat shock protein HslJ